jgi:hypothetical protein
MIEYGKSFFSLSSIGWIQTLDLPMSSQLCYCHWPALHNLQWNSAPWKMLSVIRIPNFPFTSRHLVVNMMVWWNCCSLLRHRCKLDLCGSSRQLFSCIGVYYIQLYCEHFEKDTFFLKIIFSYAKNAKWKKWCFDQMTFDDKTQYGCQAFTWIVELN